MNRRSQKLAESLLDLAGDGNDLIESAISDVYESHIERLTTEFYAWSDQLTDPMIAAGLGDVSPDDLWPHIEHTYLCVRLCHGVSFTDNFMPDTTEYGIAKLAAKLAKAQPYIESGAYLADDGTVYVYDYHTSEQ